MSDRTLERLLDCFKRYSQQAGIAQQKVAMDIGPQVAVAVWLDKAEEKRGEILALFLPIPKPGLIAPTTDGAA